MHAARSLGPQRGPIPEARWFIGHVRPHRRAGDRPPASEHERQSALLVLNALVRNPDPAAAGDRPRQPGVLQKLEDVGRRAPVEVELTAERVGCTNPVSCRAAVFVD